MKRQVRLTEGQLNRIIKESVNNILSELDWRTYQSAYEKSNGSRRQNFRQAANNSFNRQNGYGLKNVPYGHEDDLNMSADGDFYGGGNLYTYNGDRFNTGSGNLEKRYTNQNVATTNYKHKRGDVVEPDEDERPNATGFNPQRKMKQMQGDKQVRDYFNGKSNYVKGKGWK